MTVLLSALRSMVCPQYIHEDLNVPLVKEVIKQRSTIFHNKIGHVNVLIQPLLQPHNQRRLKGNWPVDLREG
jgi:hypothetical protein